MFSALAFTITGCGKAPEAASTGSQPVNTTSAVSEASDANGVSEEAAVGTQAQESVGEESGEHLIVRFGAGGESFVMRLVDNSTAQAIAGYVGTSSWQLPIYSYDESDVMEYYDIPRRYEIPDNGEAVTQAHAGDVFYSDPNRIVLYYADAEINEEYTLIGRFDPTEEFIDAVVNNPVLEGWGNQLVIISAEE